MINLAAFIPRAVVQGIPLLFGSTGEILTEKSGNLNLGIPGVMYVGAISGVIGSFFYEQSTDNMNGVLAILIPVLCCLAASFLMGLLYCFLTVTLRANQNVTGLAMTTFGVGFGNFFWWFPDQAVRKRCAVDRTFCDEQLFQQVPAVCRSARLVWKGISFLWISGVCGNPDRDHLCLCG